MIENEKTNLTLRISKEVVDKARKLGLNLSSITESMLKTENLAQDKEIITPTKVREAYRHVFIGLLNILQEWEAYLKIGEEVDDLILKNDKGKESIYQMLYIYYLSPHGKVEVRDDNGETRREWTLNEDWPISFLLDADKLIENLIDSLYNRAERNKEKINKLSLLKNVLEKIKNQKSNGKNDIQQSSEKVLENIKEN